ncbi:response regulator [Methanospirillum stamsii]|uniref:Response regulatory domain-containing protein n=1 Tax=Methanospirillum stamsii TaxID=1277351 RepID=A0A2V2NBH4_9EURY|nr:response regulator [Methanospirillum stamsii]PWR75945.1 hypothetical protein DLD82_02480 [Methanospirillum stamsii]
MTIQKTQYSILIVDDDDDNLQVAAKIISNAGLRALIASDGESALEIIDTLIPDAILLDVMMPGMSGIELCQKIKTRPDCSMVPVIFLSAVGEDSEIEKGLLLGGSDYITKPFRERVLLARLRLHIEKGLYLKEIAEKNQELVSKNYQLVELQNQLLTANDALEKQINKNLEIFAAMNDKIRNPLAVALAMIDITEDTNSQKIIEQLNRIDKAVDDLDKGFMDSDKIRSFLKKHYNID